MSTKPRGYLTRILALDTETSGLAYNCVDPSYNPTTKQMYQPLSVGLVVVDAQTLKPIDKLYVEIKWDEKFVWSEDAAKIHGLSKSYLDQNGMTMSEAVEAVGNLIIDHWGPTSPICVLGHNPQFDISFLRRLMASEGIELRFGSKTINTNAIGFAVFGTHNSDDLFETVGLPKRDKHNALDDALAALKVVQVIRALANQCFGE